MTVADLVAELAKQPQEAKVFVYRIEEAEEATEEVCYVDGEGVVIGAAGW